MWGTVFMLALLGATDPTRVGIAALLVTRPRPMLNLVLFWLGGIAAGLATALGALILVRGLAFSLMQSVSSTTATSVVRYVQIAIGVLALVSAALIAMGFSAHQRAQVLTPGGDPSARTLEPNTPTAVSRLSSRAKKALGSDCVWVPFAVGLTSTMPPVECLVALTAIATSGAAIGTQLSAALMFTIVVLAVVEVPLVSFLVTPARTSAGMLRLLNWLRARRRQAFVVMAAVTGVLLLANGMGSP
jgi:hypothetical protein